MGCASRLCSLYRRLTGSAVLLSSLPRKIPGPAPPSSSRPPLLLPIANRSNLFTVRPTAAATPFLGLSALSTFSAAGVDLSEHQSSFSHGQQDSVVSEFSEQIYIPVKAYFLCTSFDLKGLQAENAYNVIPPASRSSNYLVLRFCDIPPEVAGFGVLENGDCYRYMVVFQYGSAVLFNIADNDVERYLELARRHASGLLPEMRKDDYAVVQKPQLETWMQGGLDYIVLKNLDIDGIRIIGSVLGQSIALDYFVRQVDGMVEEFTDINRGMEKTGTFTMQRKKLFQLVGKANSNLADVILKLGLFERSEIAWRNANYAQIWEYLRDEYELTQRFGSLDFKLKFVEHNIHFLQEILQNRKSDFLEWCIILLISLEIVISVYEIVRRSPISPL
ncbi:Sad1-interacting factor 2 [Nymphaea thermarum]|nr:Sad1-interacting factor 2 [Nymphaea thermarum]